MTLAFEIIGFICCLIMLLAFTAAAVTQCLDFINQKWITYHSVETKIRMQQHMSELAMWCGYEFPIVKELAEHLNTGLVIGGYFQSCSDFRTVLRRKFGDGKFEPSGMYRTKTELEARKEV